MVAPAVVDPSPAQPPRWAVERMLRAHSARRAERPSDAYREYVPGRDPATCYQYHFHRSDHIIRGLALGNGAGKTTSAGVEADWFLQHNHPYLKIPDWKIQVIWVTLKYGQFELLREQLEYTCFTPGFKWSESEHVYEWPNGSTLTVLSDDGDWTTSQGINPDLVIIDEECDRRWWRELQMRRRGRKKTKYVIAATATKGLRFFYNDVFKPWLDHHAKLGLAEAEACRVQSHPTIWMWAHGGIVDNPVHDESDVKWYHEGVSFGSAAERQVRLGGGFMDLNAAPVFDPEGVKALEAWQRVQRRGVPGALLLDPKRPEGPDGPRFIFQPAGDFLGGSLVVWELPKGGYSYVVGADFAHGLSGGDLDAAAVFRPSEDGKTLHQVAEATGRWGAATMTFVLYALGWYFSEALIVGEANSMGLTVLQRLYRELGYLRLYHREARPQARTSEKSELLGYFKGGWNVGQLLGRLQWAIDPRDKKTGHRNPARIKIRSPEGLKQVARFQWQPKAAGRELGDVSESLLVAAAPKGEHDDIVAAYVGACVGWFELPRFRAAVPQYAPGSLGEKLGHAKVWNPRSKENPFQFAKPRSKA